MLDLGRGVAQLPTNLLSNVLTSTANLQSKGLEGYTEAQKQQTNQAIARNQLLSGLLTEQGGFGNDSSNSAIDYIGSFLSDIFRPKGDN